jgi:hypothetical protein
MLMGAMITMTACGPSCPEIKASLGADETMSEDVARVNALVHKRKDAIAEASSGGLDSFKLARLKFSVTAYEKAIETQVIIIKLSPSYNDSKLYEELAPMIADIRCALDSMAQAPEHTVSDKAGKIVGQYASRMDLMAGKECAVTSAERTDYFENGIGTE